jgi:ankyrin repeat protein
MKSNHHAHTPTHSSLPWREIYYHKRLTASVNQTPFIADLLERLRSGSTSKLEKLRNCNLYSMRIKQGSTESSRLILQPYQIEPHKEVLVIVAVVSNHKYDYYINSAQNLIRSGYTQENLEEFFNANEEQLNLELEVQESIIHHNSIIQIDGAQSGYLSKIIGESARYVRADGESLGTKNYIISGAPGTGKTLIASLLLRDHAQSELLDHIIMAAGPSSAAAPDDDESDDDKDEFGIELDVDEIFLEEISAEAVDQAEAEEPASAPEAAGEDFSNNEAAVFVPQPTIDDIPVMIYIAKNEALLKSMKKELESNEYSKFLLDQKRIILCAPGKFVRLQSLPTNVGMVLVDEYQNYDEKSLRAIKTKIDNMQAKKDESAKHALNAGERVLPPLKTVHFGDIDQAFIADIDKNKLQFLKGLYKNNIQEYYLEIPYRCSSEVRLLTWKIVQLRQRDCSSKHGPTTSSINNETANDFDRKGQIYFTTEKIENLQNITKSISYAIIVENEDSKKALKEELKRAGINFESEFLYTLEEVQGLEFEHVVLYNMLDKLGNIKTKNTEQYYNSLIVAISRASESVAIFQSHTKNASDICEKLKLVENKNPYILEGGEPTFQDYKKRIFYWLDQGKEKAARSVSKIFSENYKKDKDSEIILYKEDYLYELCIAERLAPTKDESLKKEEKKLLARQERAKKVREAREKSETLVMAEPDMPAKQSDDSVVDQDKEKTLLEAIKANNFSLAVRLITDGADIFIIDNNGKTILHHLAEIKITDQTKEDYRTLEDLVFKKISDIRNKESSVSGKRHNTRRRAALAGNNDGKKQIIKDFLNAQDSQENATALMIAIKANNFSFAARLITEGADISIIDNNGKAILHMLADFEMADQIKEDYRNLAKLVLMKIYDIKDGLIKTTFLNIQEKSAASMVAIKAADFLLATHLINEGADISTIDINGHTIIYYLEGASLNYKDKEFQNLLYIILDKVNTIPDNNIKCKMKKEFDDSFYLVKTTLYGKLLFVPQKKNDYILTNLFFSVLCNVKLSITFCLLSITYAISNYQAETPNQSLPAPPPNGGWADAVAQGRDENLNPLLKR